MQSVDAILALAGVLSIVCVGAALEAVTHTLIAYIKKGKSK